MIRTEAEGTTSVWACLFGMVSSVVNLLDISCLGSVITDLFWRWTQGIDLGGQGMYSTNFSTGAPHVYDFDLVGVAETAGVDKTGGGTTKETCTLVSSDWKALPVTFKH